MAAEEETGGEPPKAPPEGVFKRSRWPGLIWAVPVAAAGIMLWLGISTAMRSGPDVKVVFPVSGGLQPGTSKVEYNGFDVGEVSAVHLAKDLRSMTVTLSLHSVMAGHLGAGTQFWVAGNSLSLSDIASLKAAISGPFIGIDPHDGKDQHMFTGLANPPVLRDEPAGETLTLVADKLSNVAAGSPVFYKGDKVGEVRGVSMAADGSHFDIFAFIPAARERLLNSATRFWNAGGVRISTDGGGPAVQIASLPALVMGAVAFETPAGQPGAKPIAGGARFPLYPSEDAARDAPGPGAVAYETVLDGGADGLKPGAQVKLEGAPAGAVTSVRMQYDPARGAMRTAVGFVLQPARINLEGQAWNLADPAPQMNAMLAALIAKGLRAELGSAVPVVGGKIIELSLVKGQGPAALAPGNPPGVPSFGKGAGVAEIMAQVNDILASIDAMPLDQIAGNIHQATSRIAALSGSAQTKETLRRLDRTIAHVEDMTRRTDAQLPAILAQVKQSTKDADAAIAAAKGLMSVQGPASDDPQSAGLPHALYELTEAAQSLRELTDYLDEHPNALILGKGN